jgi:hypothetical protein
MSMGETSSVPELAGAGLHPASRLPTMFLPGHIGGLQEMRSLASLTATFTHLQKYFGFDYRYAN